MKVKCINKGGVNLLDADLASGNTRSSVFHVTPGHEYRVYGILYHNSVLSYLVVEDTNLPVWYPASLFEILCPTVSRSWQLVDWSSSGKYFGVLSFADIIRDRETFDQLSLGDDIARERFFQVKRVADLEFRDSTILEAARLIEGGWLQCPCCHDSWQSGNENAMVKCPACQKVLHNPISQTN